MAPADEKRSKFYLGIEVFLGFFRFFLCLRDICEIIILKYSSEFMKYPYYDLKSEILNKKS